MTTINKLKQHCIFTSPNEVYVLLAVARRKYNQSITNSTEIVFREVVTKPEQIERKYKKLQILAKEYRCPENKSYNFHMYVSVNSRDCMKAYFRLITEMNIWMQEHLNGVDNKRFKRIDGNWYSALQSPSSKSSKRFLVDVDTKDEEVKLWIEQFLSENQIQILSRNETVSGYHYVTEPFNRFQFEGEQATFVPNRVSLKPIEIKTDALFFLEYIGEPINKLLESV